MATAEAAAIVTMSMDKSRVGSVGFSAKAIAPARKKMAVADASAIRKLISLLRRRLTGQLTVETRKRKKRSSLSSIFTFRYRDETSGKRANRQKSAG